MKEQKHGQAKVVAAVITTIIIIIQWSVISVARPNVSRVREPQNPWMDLKCVELAGFEVSKMRNVWSGAVVRW